MKFKYFYKKVKYRVDSEHNICQVGEIKYSGEGDELRVKNTSVCSLKEDKIYEMIYELCKEEYNSQLEELVEFAKYNWQFDVYGVLKVTELDNQIKQSHYVMFVEIFKYGVSYDYIMLDAEGKWREIFSHMPQNCRGHTCLKEKRIKKDIIIRGQAAGVLSHELFGHLFEIDNFYLYNYEKYLKLIEKLGISISDIPISKNGPVFYNYDDNGIPAKNICICNSGELTGQLIGGDYNRKMVTHSLRRNNYKEICIPRMSNLVVNYEGGKNEIIHNYIEINKIGKCYIHHKKDKIEFCADLIFVYSEKECYRSEKKIRFSVSIFDILNNILPLKCSNNLMRPLQCQKGKQVIECGISSNDWLLMEGSVFGELF